MFDRHLSTGQDGRLFCASSGLYVPTRVFPTRRRFEEGIAALLGMEPGGCAVLHVSLQGHHADFICRRLLNLAGNTLRVCMRGGALAYLGAARFAVLLQDTDMRDTAAYARTVIKITAGFHVMWQGEVQSAEACIGGILAGGCRDGALLLAQAEAAGRSARGKAAPRLHFMGARKEIAREPQARVSAA